MMVGGEENTNVLVVVLGGGCFGPPQAQTVKGTSTAAGVIFQQANENI